MIILGSFKVATDLLDKGSQIYSDRVPTVMAELCVNFRTSRCVRAGDLHWRPRMGIDYGFGLLRYNSVWRAQRRMFHQYFQPSVLHKYATVQAREVRTCLSRILDSPNQTPNHVRQ